MWLRQGRDVLEPRNATVITGRLMQEHWLCPPPAERREGMGLGKGQSRTVADRPGAPPRCPPSNIRVAELARPSAPPASRSLGPRGRRSSPPRCHVLFRGRLWVQRATLTVRVIHLSSQNCIQADIQSPRPLPHMNLNVSERLTWALRGMSRFTDRVTG